MSLAPESELHPDSGARVLLERLSDDGESARYHVTLYLPKAKVVGVAQVQRGGRSEVDFRAEPPAWAEKITTAFLRQAAVQRTESGDPRWPRRMMRWRPEK